MKVIWTDNYGTSGESPGKDERVVDGGECLSKMQAIDLAHSLNSKCSERGPDYYRVVEDDYKLARFEP